MSEEYGNDFIVLTDEDGNEVEVEHVDTIEYDHETYMAFLPADMDISENYELIIMKAEIDPDTEEEFLVTLDDEVELNEVFEIFKKRLEETFDD